MRPLVIAVALALASCSPEPIKLVHLTVMRNGELRLPGEQPFAEAQLPFRLKTFKQEKPRPHFELTGEDGVQTADLDRVAKTIGLSGYKVGISGLVQP